MEILDRNIYHIASDYFSGRISKSDRKYLSDWLNQSDDNKRTFAELEKVWKLTGSLQSNLRPDVDSEWLRFVQNREQATLFTEPIERKKILWASPMFRVAAVTIPALLVVASLVFFLSKKSDNIEWLTINASDTRVEQILPDGSEVWINKNSSLTYPKHFKGNERMVKLSGEGFFKVEKHKGTFVIEAGSSEIKVLGTQFNVRTSTAEQTTEVLVKEGKVSFASQRNKNMKVILTTGEKGVLSFNEIKKGPATDTNPFAWMTHKLNFNNTSVTQMGNDIARYFNKTVIINPSLQNISFTGDFTNPQLEDVLRTFSLTISCTYQIKNDTVFINGK